MITDGKRVLRAFRYIQYLYTPSATIWTQASKNTVPGFFPLVGANDGQQAIALKERAGRLVGEKVRAAARVIGYEALRSLFIPKVLHWIGPEEVAHETGFRWLAKAIQLKDEHVRPGL